MFQALFTLERRSLDVHLVVCKYQKKTESKTANILFTSTSLLASVVAFLFTFALDR